ncbi:hypothetical protein K0504_05210 [Neiella marina]|uniref:Uncharacterized protein n=1 Tax=Neiella holothuriorum TaxID=2870530 RepID=A0ABS7EDM1_9GAMM|nr:hypothetical protein [Neiella holothuriorum]MBW8190428.1 hypothetical protein [Neiella holothuriorum]
MLLVVVVLHLVVALLTYVLATASGLLPNRWALLALLLGPAAIVMMQNHRRMVWQSNVGRHSTLVLF